MYEKTWEEKVRENPLYGVMSHEEFIDSTSEPTSGELEIFYARGHEMVSGWIEPWLNETGTTSDLKVLEFGCGMGRLTNALAAKRPAENIYGVDISETMIKHANANTSYDCNYAVIEESGSFPYQDNYFDRVYSYAVFQHISQRSVVKRSIAEIARVLKPGGKVKLNIEMVFPPPFENTLRQDTYALSNHSLIYGWKKISGIPLWGIKVVRSNNWSGIRLGYKQLVKEFRLNGIQIYGIKRDPANKRLIWFYGEKPDE